MQSLSGISCQSRIKLWATNWIKSQLFVYLSLLKLSWSFIMSQHHRSNIAVFLTVTVLTCSCARFQPTLDQIVLFGGTRIPSVVQTREGITVSIEEFASVNKSKQAFDSDVVSAGVLPLLFRIDSKSDTVFKIPAASIKAYLNNQPLTMLDGETAAKHAATRDYVGKALGWTLLAGPFAILAWPGTIVGSAVHTRNVNSRIVKHFETLEFKGAMVRANQPVSGFVYYQVPTDNKILQTLAETKSLQNLSVEIVAIPDEEGQNVGFNVPLPNIDLSESAKK